MNKQKIKKISTFVILSIIIVLVFSVAPKVFAHHTNASAFNRTSNPA